MFRNPLNKSDKYAATRKIPKNTRAKDEITIEDYHYLPPNIKETVLLIDVRTQDERDDFSIGGIHLEIETLEYWRDHGELDMQLSAYIANKDTPIIFYCRGGIRSYVTTLMLKEIEYTNVKSLAGGMDEWQRLNNRSCCTIC